MVSTIWKHFNRDCHIWDQTFCPLFKACPLLRGFTVYAKQLSPSWGVYWSLDCQICTLSPVTKITKGFLKEKERVKGFFFLWQCYHSTNLNKTMVKKNPVNEAVVELSFPIVWILDTVNMVYIIFSIRKRKWLYMLHTRRKKCMKWTTFDTFLIIVNFK